MSMSKESVNCVLGTDSIDSAGSRLPEPIILLDDEYPQECHSCLTRSLKQGWIDFKTCDFRAWISGPAISKYFDFTIRDDTKDPDPNFFEFLDMH